MKKILLTLALFSIALAGFSQSVTHLGYPGGTLATGALDTVSGDHTYVYFSFDRPVSAYSIQVDPNAQITGDTAVAVLQASNFMGNWTALDTLTLPDSVTTFVVPVVYTGTTAPYAIYRYDIIDTDLTGGSLYFFIHYY